jgi:hypothetical protein
MGAAILFDVALLPGAAPPPDNPAAPSLPERVARADVAAVGTVTSIDDTAVLDLDKVERRVAWVKASDVLLGAKGLDPDRIHVAFPREDDKEFPQWNLKKGQEACFLLTRRENEPFFELPGPWAVLDKKGASYDKDVELVKRCAKALADPDAGLKSKDADERYLTAALLVLHDRTPRPGFGPATEPVDADRSKRALEALAAADWSATGAEAPPAPPLVVFARLGLTDKDGWPPADAKDVAEAARKWLKDNASTYWLRRLVPPKREPGE